MLAAILSTLFAQVDDSGGSGGLVWLIVGILAIIALLIFIVRGGWRR